MSSSKRIPGIIIGACVALLIAIGGMRSTSAAIGTDAGPAVFAAGESVDDSRACGKCGDGYCNPRCGESATNCPADCGGTTSVAPPCGKCGDGYCNPRCGETATNCPRDCGTSASAADDCSY